jgi:hypothetical protein
MGRVWLGQAGEPATRPNLGRRAADRAAASGPARPAHPHLAAAAAWFHRLVRPRTPGPARG